MAMNILKLIFLIIIPSILLLATLGAYNYSQRYSLYDQNNLKMTYDRYTLKQNENWKDRFSHLQNDNFNSVRRKIIGARDNYLQIRRGYQTYLVQYDAEVDVELINYVEEVKEEGDNTQYNGRYFLIQYQRFVQIVHFDITKSSTPLSKDVANGTYQAEICLELPIESSHNVRYHIDSRSNIWIVTVSMNKVVFIQVYSCLQNKLISEIRYILQDDHFVSEINRITQEKDECMIVQVVTYSLTKVDLRVCPYGQQTIKQVRHSAVNDLTYDQVEALDFQIFERGSDQVHREEYSNIIQYIFNLLTFSQQNNISQKILSSDENQMQYFDLVVVDEQNNYLLTLSRQKKETELIALGKYVINAKTPLFHNNPNYNPNGILDVLDRQYQKEHNPQFQHKYIHPKTNQTKSAFYKAAYPTYPNYKIQHLGLGNSVMIFWPQQKLDEKDYLFIRTRDGGIVTEGTKFKGTFDKIPKQYQQIYQIVDSKPLEVVPGIYEVHVGYMNLMTNLVRSKTSEQFIRIDLLNMLGGKVVINHYLSTKQGYAYTSTMLLNNEWWILQYNAKSQQSMATKYQLYTNASNPQQIFNIKRAYGVIGSQQHIDGEDDLSLLMDQFTKANKNGYILLNVYRCVDEYYYFQYSDASGSVYGVARIHFKNVSNRRVKKSKKYAGAFQKKLILQEKYMIPQKFSRQPFAIVLKNINLFSHLPAYLKNKHAREVWYNYCAINTNIRKLGKTSTYYFYPMQFYAKGDYGCAHDLEQAHSDIIYGFNMRNLITTGKILKEQRKDVRKEIVHQIFTWLPVYLLGLGIFFLLTKMCKREAGKQQVNQKKIN